mmetsp:Transcript_23817/g.55066  ORF Transcript_23817/g.55066 Transcript_23817/m.55066 type:complete len:208 (-) Transcript_23817:2249-2872(-)
MRVSGGSTSSHSSVFLLERMPVEPSQSMVTCMYAEGEAFSTMMTAPASSFHVVTNTTPPSTFCSPCSAATSANAAASSACPICVGCSSTGAFECAHATYRLGSVESNWWKQSGSARYSPSYPSNSRVTDVKACSWMPRFTNPTTCSPPLPPSPSAGHPLSPPNDGEATVPSALCVCVSAPPPRFKSSIPRSRSVRAPEPPLAECPSW